MDPKLELERDYRRQVRRAYYKREEDFGSLQEYNDYLEEVEDIVEGLLNEATRKDTRERLEKLRTASEELTARNRARLEGEKRALSDAIAAQAAEAKDRAAERKAAEQQDLEQQRQQRQEMQDSIAQGRTSAATAQAEMALRRKEQQQAAQAAAANKPQGYQYVPSAQVRVRPARPAPGVPSTHTTPHLRCARAVQAQGQGGAGGSALAQPLEAVPEERHNGKMQHAWLTAKEEYEADPQRLQDARRAGGFRLDLWQSRYREEAFDAAALLFPPRTRASCR